MRLGEFIELMLNNTRLVRVLLCLFACSTAF
jgi:hypothetical protein